VRELRFLLVSPNREASPELIPPLAAAHLAGALGAEGIDVRLVDFMLETDPHGALRRALVDYDPDVIGLTVRNIDNTSWPEAVSFVPEIVEVAGILREHGRPVIVGGSGASISPRSLLERTGLDYLVTGEGERVLPGLVRDLAAGRDVAGVPGLFRRTPGGVRANPRETIRSPGALPPPDYSVIDLATYARRGGILGMQTKRGCPFSCNYCVYPGIEGTAVRTFPAENLATSIHALADAYGIERIFFVDSVFNNPTAHAVAVAREVGRLPVGIRYGCYASPRGFTPELAEALAASGCEGVEFGTDSLSEPTLRAFRKPFGVDDVYAAARACREVGLPQCHHLIFGGPGETAETIEETIERIEEIAPDAVIGMSGLRVYEGTALARELYRDADEVPDLLEPVHRIEPAVADILGDRLLEHAQSHTGWVLPGLGHNCDSRLFERIRETGYRGPPWVLLRRIAI
jgi:radical SAM superfamily enzyme YgiQ (UPF0313 family)